MAHAAMVDCYLHHLLVRRFGEDLEVHDELYLPPLSCEPRIRVVPGQGHALRVEVSAPIAQGVTASTDLFVALNEINLGLPYGRVYLVADDVVAIEHTVGGEDLTGDDLDNTLRFVTWVVDRYGLEMVDAFGGSTTGTTQMALPIGRASHDEDDEDDEDGTDGRMEPGVLVGASAGGYL